MYIWQFCVMNMQGGYMVTYGRTWAQFRDFVKGIPGNIICFVHNLSYEFCFLSGIYDFKSENVMAIKSRKVLRCELGNVEFRCSYLLSNMALALFANKMQAKWSKMSGDKFNYDKKRFAWTQLTKNEFKYCLYDVMSLCDSIRKSMEADGDTLLTIPLTSTGYVRRDVRNVMYKCRQQIKDIYPTYTLYRLEREAFIGGDTHANRWYVGVKVPNVKCADETSAYPYCLECEQYPIGKFYNIGTCTKDVYEDLIYNKGKAVIARVELSNIELKTQMFGCPYLHRDKCRQVEGVKVDNGRVLSATRLTTSITDVDYKILCKEYNFDIKILEAHHSKYGMLPKDMREVVNNYFCKKTELKGVEGQEIFYDKSKNKINACYGMTAQNPVKQPIVYKDGLFYEAEKDERELLEKYGEKAFLVYQWGVWTTARARYNLHEAIWTVMEQDGEFLYCDTDSVYYIGNVDWSEYDDYRINKCKEYGAVAYKDGKPHYLGVMEVSKDKIYEFKTLGAKRYAYRKDDGIHITIAGVNKKLGAIELTKKGGLDAFCEEATFTDSNCMEVKYNILPKPITYEVDGHKIIVTNNIYMYKSTYTLSLSPDYVELLKVCREASTQIWREIKV